MKLTRTMVMVITGLCFLTMAAAGAFAQSKVVTVNDPVGQPKLLAEGFKFPEGPSLDSDENVILVNFSATYINKVTPEGEVSVVCDVGGTSNGGITDGKGHVFLANTENHKILMVDLATGETVRFWDRSANGETLRGGNDFAWHPSGRLYFTDPQGSQNRPIGNVNYIDLDGTVKLFATGFCYCNGITFDKDYKNLYIGETNAEVLWRFEVNDDGTAGSKHFFFYMGDDGIWPDGLKCDTENHIWLANWSTTELWRISPKGELVYKIPMPGDAHPTNIAFGGPDMRTGYVSYHDGGNGKMYTVRMPAAGMPGIPAGMTHPFADLPRGKQR